MKHRYQREQQQKEPPEQQQKQPTTTTQTKQRVQQQEHLSLSDGDSEDDDMPLQQRYRQQLQHQNSVGANTNQSPKAQQSNESTTQQQLSKETHSSDEDLPLQQLHQKKKQQTIMEQQQPTRKNLLPKPQSDKAVANAEQPKQPQQHLATEEANSEDDEVSLRQFHEKQSQKAAADTAAAKHKTADSAGGCGDGSDESIGLSDNGKKKGLGEDENNSDMELSRDENEATGGEDDEGITVKGDTISTEETDQENDMQLAELESDIFGLVEHTIKVDYQWKQKQKDLWQKWGEEAGDEEFAEPPTEAEVDADASVDKQHGDNDQEDNPMSESDDSGGEEQSKSHLLTEPDIEPWACKYCTFLNKNSRKKCEICGSNQYSLNVIGGGIYQNNEDDDFDANDDDAYEEPDQEKEGSKSGVDNEPGSKVDDIDEEGVSAEIHPGPKSQQQLRVPPENEPSKESIDNGSIVEKEKVVEDAHTEKQKPKKKKRKKDKQAGNQTKKKKKQDKAEDPWTDGEKQLYSEGLKQHGNNWGKLSDFIKTRTALQVRTYAKKLAKKQQAEEAAHRHAHDESNKENINQEMRREDHSMASDDDEDDVPAFVTCDKCNLVFTDEDAAMRHENQCTYSTESHHHAANDAVLGQKKKKIFDDPLTLVNFLVDLQSSRNGQTLREDDQIYFQPKRVISPDDASNRNRLHRHGDSTSGGPPTDINQDDDEAQEVEKDHEEDDDCDEGEALDMNLVSHLCSTTIDPDTGLPKQKIAVMCGESGKSPLYCSFVRFNALGSMSNSITAIIIHHSIETLFDFRVDIKQSNIPGAGHGAFLTYLGARVLKPRSASRSERLMKEHVVEALPIDTHNPLVAETLGGKRMTVRLVSIHYFL